LWCLLRNLKGNGLVNVVLNDTEVQFLSKLVQFSGDFTALKCPKGSTQTPLKSMQICLQGAQTGK